VKDYYAVLSLSQSATQQQIRSRFLELARKRHPDLFKGDEKAQAENDFQDITEAFNVLSNPERRRLHDIEVTTPTPSSSAMSPKQTVRSFLQRGSRAYREGRYSEAALEFERATAVDGDNATAWYNLALAASRDPSLRSKALSAVARATELDRMNVTYHKLAGKLFVEAGMPLRAERYYRRALQWAEQDAEVHAALERLKRSK
jgi:curved DNA-binding protein CbpA